MRTDMERSGQTGELRWSRYAQMRYVGQGFEVHVDLPDGPIDETYAERAIGAFKEAYMRKHRFLDAEGTIEVVDWTLVGAILAKQPGAGLGKKAGGTAARSSTRRAWFPEAGGYVDTAVLDRQTLAERREVRAPPSSRIPTAPPSFFRATSRASAQQVISSSTSPER